MMKAFAHPLRRPIAAATAILIALFVAGCSTVQEWAGSIGEPGTAGSNEATAADARRQGDPGPSRLAEGVERYEAGDFVGAIRSLNAPEILQSDARTRVEAGKYLAFSYCVTHRRTLCRKTFDRVLAIDPSFELQPAEAGHPLWGPVFVQARKAAEKRVN